MRAWVVGFLLLTGALNVERGADGKIAAIRNGNGVLVATFQYDEQGNLRRVTADGQTVELSAPRADGSVRTSLESASGGISGRIPTPGSIPIAHPDALCLDPIRAQLHIDEARQKRLTFRPFASGIDAAVGEDGKARLYVVHGEGMAWVFDVAGKPLLIDLAFPLAAPSGHDAGMLRSAGRGDGATPTHLIVTADGRIGGCSSGSIPGTLASFWTEHGR